MPARLPDTAKFRSRKSNNSISAATAQAAQPSSFHILFTDPSSNRKIDMLANELIDRLERLALLDQEIIEALREQLEQGGTRVTPEAVAKLLVDNGQLTRFQATKLIGELRSDQYDDDAGVEVVEVAEVDELGILPEEGAEVEVVEVAEAEPVEADVFAEPVAAEAVPVEAMPVEAMAVEAMAVEAMPVEAMGGGGEVPAGRPTSKRVAPDPTKSVWDSFKIYGYLGIIAFLILAGGILYFILSRENADDVIKLADDLYNQQNYVGAQERYVDFLDLFGEYNQYSSRARTVVVMTELYRAEAMSNPTRALEVAKEKLPQIEEEEGLNDERGNLAALLVDIADNIATAAGKETETAEKETLLEKLDEQMEMMENPMYMTASMRSTLGGRIKAVEEARARVRRDIDRNKSLDAAVASMRSLLDEQNTKQAYDVRMELLRRFPELDDNERLTELILEASKIQQALVAPAAKTPKLGEGVVDQKSLKTIVLTTLEGSKVPGLRNEHLYLRAAGSVLALDGETGKLLWRRFVGYGQDHAPLRLEAGEGVLLSDSATLEIQRCNGEDGTVLWRSQVGELFSEPVVQRDDIYSSAKSGTVFALDADSGDAKWATQIPQELEVSPGVDSRVGRAYLPGDHSNLYVLNTRDGSCIESYYIGHAEGTIAVPAIPLLGHVFVVENKGTDYCNVHILRADESGQNLKRAQDPVRMTGNVKAVPFIIQQRRIIMLTDRGQVNVFDVEPTAENEQVTVVAKQVATYDEPTATQMAVGRSQMWITGTRIGRYELQINTGRVVADWTKYEGDSFFGQPFANDDALVHARVLRGTTAIRVTACDPKSGAELWRNDVGVPVAMLVPAPGGGSFHAVTTQGALFELDRESLQSGSTQGPIENPGGNGVAMRFEHPVMVDQTRRVLLNQESKGQLIAYEPDRVREKLRLVTMSLPDGSPSGGALISGGGLFIPLDSGRCVLMNWQTGPPLGSPFQPPADPSGQVGWTNPVRLPSDPDQVVIADTRKKLYRLRVGEQMRALAQTDLPSPFLGTAAAVGETFVATIAGPSADSLVGRDMNSLKESFRPTLLEGRVAWGPVSAGDVCLLQTDDKKLRAFGADGKQRFTVDLPAGEPTAEPVQVGENWILAGRTGWIVVINPDSGELVGQTNLGQPISAAPLVVGSQLLVPGAEGVVYITPVPAQ
jgi:outer membrane protein assembly factor BamB